MDRNGTLKRQLYLGILALCIPAMVAACAGPPAKAAADPDSGRQTETVPVADAFKDAGVPPSSGHVALSAQSPSLQQAPEPEPAESRGGVRQPIATSKQQPETNPQVSDGTQQTGVGVPPSSGHVALSAPSPSPRQAPEPEPAESRGGVRQPTTTSKQQSETNPQVSDGTQETAYTWQDGDRTQTVILQPDLVIDDDASTKGAEAEAPGGAIVKSADAQGQGQPVFKSQSGTLMTLPGGVLLVLDPEWTQTQVNDFFSSNGIKLDALLQRLADCAHIRQGTAP